jgi:predicted alpha/beta superfamily hydrolase
VLFLLDGDVHFQHTAASVRFLSSYVTQVMPELIVVAVVNRDRQRDFTPATGSADEAVQFPTHGGAPRFLRFLRDELIPWVNDRYRTNEYRVLAGHSLSGLFVIHALAAEPDVFNAYIAISPSLWWNNQGVIRELEDLLESRTELRSALFMATGDEPLIEDARALVKLIQQHAPARFRWALEFQETQSHNSVAPPGLYGGLGMVFDGWNVTDAVFGMFEDSSVEDIELFYEASGESFGIERTLPEIMVHNFQAYLIEHERLEEAGELMMYEPSSYGLVPVIVDQLVNAYLDQGEEARAIDVLRQLLLTRPFDPIVAQQLNVLSPDP